GPGGSASGESQGRVRHAGVGMWRTRPAPGTACRPGGYAEKRREIATSPRARATPNGPHRSPRAAKIPGQRNELCRLKSRPGSVLGAFVSLAIRPPPAQRNESPPGLLLQFGRVHHPQVEAALAAGTVRGEVEQGAVAAQGGRAVAGGCVGAVQVVERLR